MHFYILQNAKIATADAVSRSLSHYNLQPAFQGSAATGAEAQPIGVHLAC
jgi:hypothetical protein